MEDRLRQEAEDALTASRAHHENDADARETDADTDDDVRNEDARGFGAEHDRTGCEQQRHEHDEVHEPLGDDRSKRLADGHIELLPGEIRAVDVAHLRGHDAIDEERGDHDPDERP